MNKSPKNSINNSGGFNFSSMMVVLRKELSDMFRDRKTLVSSLLIPMLLMPVLFTLMSRSADSMIHSSMEDVYVSFSDVDQEVKDYIWSKLEVEEGIILSDISDPVKSLSADDGISVLISVEDGAAEKLAAEEPFSIQFVYDDMKSKSSGAASRIMSLLSQFNDEAVRQKLLEQGIDLSALAPMRLSMNTVGEYAQQYGIAETPREGTNNLLLSMIIPMLVPMLIALGGVSAATDLVAGEKERGTFEPLLSTPAPRLSILLGKYISVVFFAVVSAVCSSFGYVLAMFLNRNSTMFNVSMSGEELGSLGSFSMPVGGLLLTLLILIMLGMMFASIEIMLSTYARSFKEASTYLSFLTIIVMLPSMTMMMMQAGDITLPMMLVPIMNAVGALKMVLAGFIDYAKLLTAIGSSAVYVVVCLVLAVRMFGQESVLFRS